MVTGPSTCNRNGLVGATDVLRRGAGVPRQQDPAVATRANGPPRWQQLCAAHNGLTTCRWEWSRVDNL
jgi:hypothetical protein